jgi:hypothetical protein
MAKPGLLQCPVCQPDRDMLDPKTEGKWSPAHFDGHGIFLFYACDECYEKKIKGYRPDILTHYECDEPIEAEDY